MKAKTKVGKITGGVLAGILSCGALSSPLSIQAVKLENINIETQNKEIKVKVYEDINGKIKIQLRSDKDVSDVDLKLTIDKNKILTYKYKKIFAGETIEFEIDDSDLENAVSKILPKTSSVRKNIFFMGTTKNHIVSGNISYSVEEELEKPEVPKKPEKPETKPKTLKDSGTPEVKPETPKESETPEAKPEVPKEPEHPEAKPETPKEPEHPEVKPEMPKEPGTPETKPETPKDSGTPEVKPETPKESETPEAKPEVPKEPEHPEAKPEVPKEPEHPEVKPEMPKEPGTPETKPETPKESGTPEVKPEVPKESEQPEATPEMPKEPEQPEVKPETPKESEHPEATPETPKEPEHPEVKPETPKEPEQPKVSEEKEETEIALLIQSSNNFPIMDKLTYEIVSEEDKTDRQEVVSEDGMLREVGVYKNTIYVLKLKDNKKYEMAPIRFIVDNNNGVAKRVDTKADIIELPLTKKEVSPQLLKEETQVSLLIQSNNGRPVLDKLEYVIVSEEDETDRQEVVSENGMLREVGVYKNTIYVLKLKDNKKYEMPPIRFIVNNDYEVARKVEVDEDITEIKLIKKQEQENNKENKTVDTLRVVVKKDNKVIPNSQVRLLKRELGIPNIISTVYTNENGEVNFTNLDPSSDYEVLMTNKEYNFSEDRYKFTTDSSGKLKVDNLVSVSNNIATVEFNAYSKGSSEPENATVTFKVINKETGDAVEGVELSVSVLQPKLGTYKKGVSNKDGNVVFTLIGQENGKNYAVTVSKNAQFLWRFEPSDISFTVDENGVIKYDNNAQPIIKVTPDNREHLKSDLQSKIVEVEKLLEKIYTNEAAVNNLRTILAGAKAELEKIETVPYYVEELLININKSIEEVKKYQDNSNEIVTIEDKLLKKVINKNINKDRAGDEDITRGELSKLTKLSIFLNNNGEADIEGNTIDILGTPKNLSGTKDFKFAVSRGIKSLSGLEYATNLEYLKLNENEISELLPLANLTKLKYIELQRNRIKNVEELANLTKLEYLKLYNNLIEDISPLKNLTKLTGLDVHYNVTVEGTEDNKIISKGITDVSVISNMPNLRYLDVSANRIEDISVIKNLNKLEDIDFSGNNIKDYTSLSNYIADKLEKSLNEGEGSIGFASQKVNYNKEINVNSNNFNIESPFLGMEDLSRELSEKFEADVNLFANVETNIEGLSAKYNKETRTLEFTASDKFLKDHNGRTVPVNIKLSYDEYAWQLQNIGLHIVDEVEADVDNITEFSTRQKFIKAKGGALLATLKGENLVKEDISFDVFANDEKVDNVSYETQGFWDNNEVNYIFSIPENNTNREIEYKIKPKVKNKVIDSLGLEITQKKKEEVKKLNLAPKGIYFNEDNSVIEVVFDKNISNAKENLEELKKTIKLSKGQANENFTPYKKLMDTDRVSISENKIIINLTESIPAEEAIFCRLKIDEAAIKDNDNNYSEEIALFINSHKEAKKSKITDYNIKNPILLLNGGIVEVDIIGENLNNPKIKIIDSNKAEINTELTDSITYEKVGEKIIARINLPANTTNSTKSYVVTFIQEDGSIFNRYLKDGSNRGDRPALSVLSEGKLLTDTTLSNVNISSYATNGGGSSDNNLNLTHTVTSKGQNSKKTESHIYGTNLSETKTKVKIVDQNGVEWPIFVSGSSLTGVYPKMVIPGNSKVGNGIVGDGNHQLAEIILPDELDRDMLYTYYFAVDGENYDYTKPVTALVEKTKGQVSAEKRTIIVKYQDEAGKELKDAKELTGYSWFNYSVSKDNIENYQFLNVKDNKELSGEFGTEDKEIVLVYKEKVSEDLADEGYKQELNNEINEKLSKNEKFQAADTDKKGQYATIRTEARQVAADKQATKSQVNEVVLKLKEAKKEVLLSGAKNLAKDTIDNLQNIDKTHYKELIDSASNSEEVEKFLQEAREQSKKEKESITEFTSKQNIIKNTGGYYRATVKGSGLKPEDISFTIKKDNIKVSDIAYEVQSSSETEVNYLFNIPFNEDSVEHSYKLIAKLKGEVVPLSALTFTIQAKEQMLEMSARVKDFYFELFNDYSKFDKKYKRLTDEANLKYNLVKKPKTDKNFTEKDFEMLKEFHIVKNNIDDELVAPLKFAKNLEVFSVLQNNKNLTRTVTDFSFLKNTPKLKQFYYSNQDPESKEKISLPEIDFSTNTALEDVRITKTDLGNLDLISERNLKSLSVEDNNISDISALENMTILTRLDLDNNKVTDVSNLSTLTGLKTLYLRENPISNISSLEPLKNLEALHLKGTNISDISVIEQLPNLHRLVIENNSHLENYMDTIKRKNSLNVVYVDKISKDDYEWLKQFSIRDSVDATENEDKVRDYSFRKLPLIINVESGSINNGEVTIDNPLQDWNGEKVIPEEVPENVRFEGDKIIISNVESNKKIAYKIYLENYENMYGEYSQPATIQGTVEITLNVVENSSTDKELPSRV